LIIKPLAAGLSMGVTAICDVHHTHGEAGSGKFKWRKDFFDIRGGYVEATALS